MKDLKHVYLVKHASDLLMLPSNVLLLVHLRAEEKIMI